ncbi:hypothetical protein RR46_01125 [Papilio xuthus]|uniref:Uncharacterized protein n=1 Tax=Papilio xuthus TaxID=66420 RepID=A0A0N0PA78_PAPXU|nr:hypothetical protein RR46_01125 [Papilio xuthus]
MSQWDYWLPRFLATQKGREDNFTANAPAANAARLASAMPLAPAIARGPPDPTLARLLPRSSLSLNDN